MTNPVQEAISAYATEEEAYAEWAKIIHNDKLVICACHVGLGQFNPAPKPACYVILPKTWRFAR